MDIKDLNKSQLILLTLLLSFITSIATGITTVTLLREPPSATTTPISRVIRQTVERIEQVQGKTVTETIVVKEEDLVVDTIANNQSAVFSVSKEGFNELGAQAEVSAGRGFAVTPEGIVVVDSAQVFEGGTYYLTNASGKFHAAFLAANNAGFSLLELGAPFEEGVKATFSVPVAGDLSAMKPGQKVIILGETITSFILDSNQNMKINTSKSNAGGLVLNLDGQALGIALTSETASFAPISAIDEAVKALAPPPNP
ncbi:MAG: hypothetical protein AAB500_02100 [Patescibacteria group bacterium]